MKVIFHAGANKTGSSSVQFALARHRAQLAEAGIVYPLLSHVVPDEHWPLAAQDDAPPAGYVAQRIRQDGRPDLAAQVATELQRACDAAAACDGVLLLSTESLGARQAPLRRLRTMAEAAGGRAEAMIYLRPYPDLFVSGVQHNLKAPDAPLVSPPGGQVIRHRALVAAFGADRVHGRVFARSLLSGGDVVSDFHGWLQERIDRPVPAFAATPERNAGMVAEAAALMNALSAYGHEHVSAMDYRRVLAFVTDHASALPGSKLRLSPAMTDHLRQVGAAEWNAVLQVLDLGEAARSEVTMPVPAKPVSPYSEAETRAWVASHWSQAYLEAVLALAAQTPDATAQKVRAVLTKVFKPARTAALAG